MDCSISSNEIQSIIDLLDKSISNLKDLDLNNKENDLKNIEYTLIKAIINIEFIRTHMTNSEDKNELESVKKFIEQIKDNLNDGKNISEKIEILESNKIIIKGIIKRITPNKCL